ncbi:hypothetical protein [Ancylobacter sp.]|uniref:hypothetical protein n=1 Tax=Ancylobacter sp. TaxID=1872567 RepID=UPI003BAC493E
MPTLYSRAYMQPEALLPDSRRLRVRLAAIASQFELTHDDMARLIRRKLGVEVPSSAYGHHFSDWLLKCEVRDLLDFVTLGVVMLTGRESERYIKEVAAAFAEENVAYEVTSRGEVRPKVDNEFAATIQAALARMDRDRYRAIRKEFEEGQAALTAVNPDWSRSTYHTFRANEILFKLIDPAQPRLAADKAEQVYTPLVQAAYVGNRHLILEATSALRGYKNWINAAHFERHAPGSEEPHDMPQSLGALMVSQGASYLRWLLDLDGRVNGAPTPEGESPASA